MTIKYTGEKNKQIDLTPDKEYAVLSVEKSWFRIVDDSGSDYLYPPDMFEIITE